MGQSGTRKPGGQMGSRLVEHLRKEVVDQDKSLFVEAHADALIDLVEAASRIRPSTAREWANAQKANRWNKTDQELSRALGDVWDALAELDS